MQTPAGPTSPRDVRRRAGRRTRRKHAQDQLGRRGEDGAREQSRDSRRAAEPADPDLCGRPGPRRLRAEPVLDHTTRSSTTPPGNFLTGSGATLTNDSLRTNARAPAAGAMGRRPLHGLLGCLEADDQRCLEPLQPAARLGPLGGLHTAAPAQLHHRQHAADAAAQPGAAAGRRHRAAADPDPDLARRAQRLLRSGRTRSPGCRSRSSRSSSRRRRSRTTSGGSTSAPWRRSTSSRPRPRSRPTRNR